MERFTTRAPERHILLGLQDRFIAYDEFVDAASASIVEAATSERVVSLLVADVDHFQRLAALRGEEYAQESLRAVLEIVRRELRQGDRACYPGGDELLVLLRAEAEDAREVAERLCAAIRGHSFPADADGTRPPRRRRS